MHVLLIDDHELVRVGLRTLVQELAPGSVVTEASSCEHALDLTGEPADLILLDMMLPGANRLDAFDQIRLAFDSARIVAISGINDPTLIYKTLQRGASGFVLKSYDNQITLSALRQVLVGGIHIPPEVLRFATQTDPPPVATRSVNDALRDLTDRQQDILFAAAIGQSNKVIARQFDIAEGTVKAHLAAVFSILDVKNRTQALLRIVGMSPSEVLDLRRRRD